jgi:hypothetical protein
MATQELGIKLSLDGTSGIVGGLSQVAGKLGDLENASDKVSGAFKSLGAAAIAALGVGSVAALSSMVKGYIDAAEALKDLSIKTGASVENLSAFASIGKLTGTTADTIGQAMNRLAKTMAGSSEESKGAAQALKALGIDFAAFDAMRPDDKIVTLAKAMNQFEDGSAKSAVAMTLMGKSGADLLPFMRDLGNQGELVAKITAEQAEMADQYNDALTVSAIKTEDMKRALALGLLPALISLHDLTQLLGGAIKDYLAGGASKASAEFDAMKGVIRTVGTVLEALIVLASDVAFVFKGIGTEIGGIAAQAVAFLTGDFKAIGTIRQQMLEDSQKAREELDRFQASVLGSTDKIIAQRDAVQNHSLSAAENRNEMDRLGKAHGATGTKVLEYKAATESTKVVIDQAAKAGQDYINSLDLQFAALNAQISAGRELTKAEQELLKLEEDLRSGKKKLTEDELASVKAKLETIDAIKEEIKQREDLLKTQGKVAELSTKLQDAQIKETDALRKGNVELQTQLDALVLAPKELAAREAATLRSRAADLEWQAAMEGGNYQLEEQARLLRERAGLVETGVMVKEAKDAAAEWKKTADSITNDLTDALMRGFENGKGFVENLVDYVKNKFKTMVAEYIVKPLMEPLGQAIAGFMAPVRDAISGMVSGLSSQLGKIITDLTGISLRSAGTSAAGSAAAGSATAGATAAGTAAAGTAAAGTAAAGTAATVAGTTATATGSAAVGTAAAATGATAAGITTAGSVAGEAAIALGVDTALSTAAGTAAAASGTAAAGSGAAVSAGLQTVAAAIPWALAAIAAYQVLFGGDTSGTPHQGGSVQADANGSTPTDGSGIGFKVDRDDRVVSQLSALGNNLATSLNDQRAAAGLPRDVAVELGYADDSSKDGAWGQFKLMVGGQTMAFWGSRNKWPGQALADGTQGWAQFIGLIDETVKSVFSGGMSGKPSGITLPEDFLATGGDMPAGWNGWGAKDKIDWLNGHSVGSDALRTMGVSEEDLAWMLANGYKGTYDTGNGYALGGVFTNSLVTRPTAFPMGLMGEAGPEAIMPLARSSDGSLGVRAQADGLGGAAVSTLERLISRVSQLEAALVGALERNARIVSDSIVLEGGRA